MWGLQGAFLSPVLSLILVSLYGATPAEVGWVLAVYNAGGFVAALVVPRYADRTRRYLPVLLVCGALTLALAVALGVATTLPLVTVALVVIGGPAGVGSSLLFAHLMHSGASTADVVNTRAVMSFAWIAGPPLATGLIGWFGPPSVLVAIGIVAVFNILTTTLMIRVARRPGSVEHEDAAPAAQPNPTAPAPRLAIPGRAWVVMVAFVLAQATNAAAVAVIALFVTQHLQLLVIWAGVAAALAAGLEIPALMVLGRLSGKRSELTLLVTGCVAGVGYYLGMAVVTDPVVMLVLQALNAWFFAAVAGIGLTLFGKLIPGPGLATGFYANTRKVGAILSGSLVAIASTPWGYPGVYLVCAVLTAIAAAVTWFAGRRPSPSGDSVPSTGSGNDQRDRPNAGSNYG
jgi:SET family sugar efflux transporter-like MFS transporter